MHTANKSIGGRLLICLLLLCCVTSARALLDDRVRRALASAAVDPEQIVKDIRSKTMLNDNAIVPLQVIDHDTFVLDGRRIDFSPKHLTPINVYSENKQSHTYKLTNHDDVNDDDGSTILLSIVDNKLMDVVKYDSYGQIHEVMPVANSDDIYSTIQMRDRNNTRLHELETDEVYPGGGGLRRNMRSFGDEEEESDTTDQTNRDLQSVCRTYRVIRIALRYDSTFCSMFGNSQTAANSRVEQVVSIVSSFYEVPGICVRVRICSLEGDCGTGESTGFRAMVRSSNGICDGGSTLLTRFRSATRNIPSSSQCDAVHLLYGFQPRNAGSTIGCAYIGSMCGSYAVGVNYFGYDRSAAGQAVLLAHELGHNVGCNHARGDSIMGPRLCDCTRFSQTNSNIIARNIIAFERQSSSCIISEAASTSTKSQTPAPTLVPTPTPTRARTPSPVTINLDTKNKTTKKTFKTFKKIANKKTRPATFAAQYTNCGAYSTQFECDRKSACQWDAPTLSCMTRSAMQAPAVSPTTTKRIKGIKGGTNRR